ncbi:MAG: acyl dehydratase [Alphaproteobacteria bacterium]|nr:acyl dehydratase [Alphaproteobacteria bacterium]
MKRVRGQSWHFDDIPVGYVHQFGAAKVDADDLALFQERFAPYLPLKADGDPSDSPPAAQAHVFALWSRMLWEETKDWPVLARLGQDAVRWYKTAHAGDVLTMKITFMSKQPINENRGILITQHDVLNQSGELVMTLMTRTVMARV